MPVVEPLRSPVGVRAAQKEETRRRVLEAGRSLFLVKGYDATQIREVADAAGVAVGTVLAHYTSKAELFTAIVRDEYAATAALMRAADRPEAAPKVRVAAMIAVAYERHFEGLDLIRAANLASWACTPEAGVANHKALQPFAQLLAQPLRAACDGRASDRDVTVAAGVLVELYLTSFRQAIFGGWPIERMKEFFAVAADIVVEGLAARSRAAAHPG